MAPAFLKSFDSGLEVYSAGTQPAREVHPMAIRVMREIGIDISTHKTQSVDAFLDHDFDFVITVCGDARESCPVFLGNVTERLHIGFEDPAAATGSEAEILAVFRRVRDEIKTQFSDLYHHRLHNE